MVVKMLLHFLIIVIIVFLSISCCPKFCQDAAMVKEKVMPRRDSPAWPWSRSHSSLPTAESRALLKTASTASWCSRCNLASPQKYLDTETVAHGSGININTNKTKKKYVNIYKKPQLSRTQIWVYLKIRNPKMFMRCLDHLHLKKNIKHHSFLGICGSSLTISIRGLPRLKCISFILGPKSFLLCNAARNHLPRVNLASCNQRNCRQNFSGIN